MTTEYGLVFSVEKCIQCHACETACKRWRELLPGIRWRRVTNIWQGRYPDIRSTSLSLGCLHCLEPACMAACPSGAISKSPANGLVLVDQELCSGCRACAEACPFGVPQFGPDEIMQKCDLCMDLPFDPHDPPCVQTCPTGALALARMTAAGKQAMEAATAACLQTGPES